MAKDGRGVFDRRQPQICTTTRNMIYSYYDFQPDHEQIKSVALLLHGHGDLSFGWRSTISALLAQGIRCIVPDLLGFGESSKPVDTEAYRMRLMTTDMLEILVDVHVPENARVEFPGMDTTIDLRRMLTYAPVIHRFVACISLAGPYIPPFPMKISLDQFISQNPNFGYWKFFTSTDCPRLLRRRLPIFWNAVVRTGDESVVPMAKIEARLRAETPPAEWQQRPALWDQTAYETYLTAYWRGGWEAPMNWYKAFLENYDDERQFVGTKLESPFLIVLGAKDPAVPLQATEGTEKFLAKYQIISLPCGHWIPQESGPALAKTIFEWLETLQVDS